ncbi:hypothetical protein AVEN_53913-1 [Araneus ventricosus]|uniref:Uncharacterized protein n=1 Tax=Araneus ventricosus TaxID=182803 RepID=A0A4Y2IEQ1_ARAVE|nr:hypothetical protein AVEN_53913-1 [Araneus ventricosus]
MSAPHRQEDVWPPTYDLACNNPTYTEVLQWNQVSNLEPSGPKPRPYHWATASLSAEKRTIITECTKKSFPNFKVGQQTAMIWSYAHSTLDGIDRPVKSCGG